VVLTLVRHLSFEGQQSIGLHDWNPDYSEKVDDKRLDYYLGTYLGMGITAVEIDNGKKIRWYMGIVDEEPPHVKHKEITEGYIERQRRIINDDNLIKDKDIESRVEELKKEITIKRKTKI